jgi:hypothetical protein
MSAANRAVPRLLPSPRNATGNIMSLADIAARSILLRNFAIPVKVHYCRDLDLLPENLTSHKAKKSYNVTNKESRSF